MQQRRLSRLYGSNANIRRGRTKEKNEPAAPTALKPKEASKEKVKENKEMSEPKRRGTMEKFANRKIDVTDLEIHHNHDIAQPWYSGYQNSSSLSGYPQALVSR